MKGKYLTVRSGFAAFAAPAVGGELELVESPVAIWGLDNTEMLLLFDEPVEALALREAVNKAGFSLASAPIMGNEGLPGGWLDVRLVNAPAFKIRALAEELARALGAREARNRVGGTHESLACELEALEIESEAPRLARAPKGAGGGL